MSEHPAIRPIDWISASDVLRFEDRHFTVWLADNLALLADALGLDEIRLVEIESRVESFRADILAVADDGSDDGLPIVIENQYGNTNHDHLGKLITYMAAQQRGLGVWVVEQATDAHRAAVDFLNRTSDGTVGYALLIVRFAHAPDGEYYVDFDVLEEPNEWLQTTSPATRGRGRPERRTFLEQVAQQIDSPLGDCGWSRIWVPGGRSAMIRLNLPTGHPLGGTTSRIVLRAALDEFTFRHNIRLGSFERSCQVIDELRSRYDQRLREALEVEADIIHWHALDNRAGAVNDQLKIAHSSGGYEDLQPDQAATWATHVCCTWLRLLNEDPPSLREDSEAPL